MWHALVAWIFRYDWNLPRVYAARSGPLGMVTPKKRRDLYVIVNEEDTKREWPPDP